MQIRLPKHGETGEENFAFQNPVPVGKYAGLDFLGLGMTSKV